MRKPVVGALALLAIALFAGARPACAQEARATLGGKVTDAQGAVVPSAEVVVTSDDTNVRVHTKTNEQGNWSARFLLPGHYSFTVSAAGFKQAERHGVELHTPDIKQSATQLEIGSTSASVVAS